MFCKRKKQPNTLADLWTADIIKLSFTWICDISHRASSPSRSSNCFCLSHLPLIALRNCNICGSRCENTCWPAITHRGTTETFLFFFFYWLVPVCQQGLCHLETLMPISNETESSQQKGQTLRDVCHTRLGRTGWFPKPFFWFNAPCGYLLLIVGETLILQLDIA